MRGHRIRAARTRAQFAGRLLAASLLTLATAASSAPPAAGEAQALSLYRQSTEAYDGGRFQEAADLLLRAYALRNEPVLLFNLARAYEGMGDLRKAVDAYRGYLAGDPAASDRRSVEQRVATLERQLEERASLEKQRDDARAKAERERRTADEDARRRDAAESIQRPTVIPWVLAGVGVAGLAAGVVLGVLSRSHYLDASSEPYADPARRKYGTAQAYATAANVAFVVGGAMTATGIAWEIVRVAAPGKSARPHAAVSVGPASLLLEASF